MSLKEEFSRGATPRENELRGYYEVRLVTGILPDIRFFGHRKFFPDDVGVENGGPGGFNEFLGRIRVGSFKVGTRDSVLGDGQRILWINYDRKGNGFLLRPLNDELKRTGDGRYLGRGVFRFGTLAFNSFYFSVIRPAPSRPGK
jgi:hypothetical protein